MSELEIIVVMLLVAVGFYCAGWCHGIREYREKYLQLASRVDMLIDPLDTKKG